LIIQKVNFFTCVLWKSSPIRKQENEWINFTPFDFQHSIITYTLNTPFGGFLFSRY